MRTNLAIKLTCQICGGDLVIEVDALDKTVTCSHCGKDNNVTDLISTHTICPICKMKDQAQKVSGLVLTISPLAQHLRAPDKPLIPSYEEYVRSQPTLPSTLTTKSSLQKKPYGLFLFLTIFFSIYALAWLFFFVVSILSEEYSSTLSILVSLVIFSGLAIFIGRHAAKANKHNKEINSGIPIKRMQIQGTKIEEFRKDYEIMAASKVRSWMRAMKLWEMLYYCSRDNIIYIPGAGDYARVSDMLTYINANSP